MNHVTQNKAASPGAPTTSIRAHIAEQQWGGFVSDFWTYFKSVADMNTKVAANPAWSVIEHEVVTW